MNNNTICSDQECNINDLFSTSFDQYVDDNKEIIISDAKKNWANYAYHYRTVVVVI